MTFTKSKILLFAFFAILCVAAGLFVKSAQAEAFKAEQKAEIEAIIKSYLAENPEIVIEALDAYRMKQEEAKQEQAAAKIQEHEAYFKSADVPVAGNPDGEILVVEFFDYNCGYCKRALPDVQSILETEKNVRFVFQEMPILGPTSLDAAKWAEAAAIQGKYFEYHQALMDHNGAKDEATLTSLAEKIGLDVEKMKTDAASEAVMEKINKSVTVARDIGISGTPAFVVQGTLYPGYLGEDGLKAAVSEARKGQ